jgi:hypothetical protein
MQVPLPDQTGLQDSSLIFFYLVTPCTRGAHVHAWTKQLSCQLQLVVWYCEPGGAEECIETVHTLCEYVMQCIVASSMCDMIIALCSLFSTVPFS